MAFTAKTLDIISSYSIDEQLHIYKKARKLKEAFDNNDEKTLDLFRSNDKNIGIYEVFLEDSTRTKESFRNAIEFHRIQEKIFDVQSSSFNKKESYADTFNMLTGYHNKIFIVRSKLEGVCTWLARNGENYANRNNLPVPLFINAGDGKHEHPTQELLDQFTLLEANKRDRWHIHIALIGDLLHGRTIHSKIDGLRIYKKVMIDLIAPTLLELPQKYRDKMIEYWYELRFFNSIDEYLTQQSIAPSRYFTRLQIERMGEQILQQETRLRYAITFRKDHLDKIDQNNTKFYHPLPRHKIYPEIPSFLDNTPLNGWENQSRNGMLVRIILLGIMTEVPYIINDFDGETVIEPTYKESRIQEIIPDNSTPKQYSSGVNPIQNGIVIDHIYKWTDIALIKKQMTKIVSILWLYSKWGERISNSSTGENKGIIFRPDFVLDRLQIKKLAALAPWCTLNEINNSSVSKKLKLSMPPKLYDFELLSCKNPDCISHNSHEEHVISEFVKTHDTLFECIYCGFQHQYAEVWDD